MAELAVGSLSIKWQWHHFAELSNGQLYSMLQLRSAVFVVEQTCPYLDIDGQDQQALHLLGWHQDTLVATLRLFPKFPAYENRISIGRVCSHPDYRRFGAGRALMQQAVDYIDQRLSGGATQIGAQQYLTDFYQSFGFEQCSEMYLEDGIEHIHMLRPAR